MSVRTRFILDTAIGVLFGCAFFVLVLALSHKHFKQLDVTNNGRFTLSEQSTKAIQTLEKPIRVLAFVDEQSKPKTQELMHRYQHVDPAKFSYELVFPRLQPGISGKYDVRTPGTAVVEVPGTEEKSKEPTPEPKEGEDKVEKAKTRQERAASLNEEEITNAILKLQRHAEIKIYTLAGHGERDGDAVNELGMAKFKASLLKEGFVLSSLNFAKDKTIPTDCKVLIIAGPKAPLLKQEEDMVRDFLKNNGRIFLMLEPETPAMYRKLVADYGIDCPDRVILDPVSARLGAEPVFALGLGQTCDRTHPITKDFQQNVLFQLAQPILPGKAQPEGAKVATLMSTAQYAFTLPTAEILNQAKIEIQEGKYPPAIQGLVMAGTYSHPSASPTPEASPTPGAEAKKNTPESRLVVIGDADFLSNANYKVLGARDLGLNIVNWLAESENQISIRPKDADGTPMNLTGSDLRKLFLLQCILLPLSVIGIGLSLSWRRR